jgi:hypothetical protein
VPRLEASAILSIIGIDPEVIVFRGVVTASLVSLALVGCTAQSLAPSQRAHLASENQGAMHVESRSTLQSPPIIRWNPTAITMKDGGPYVATTLAFTHGDTVVVSYDKECDYRIDFDLHPGPTKHNVETDEYDFYAYSGKTGSPRFHCFVNALLKNANGKVIANAYLSAFVTYPEKHGHGG